MAHAAKYTRLRTIVFAIAFASVSAAAQPKTEDEDPRLTLVTGIGIGEIWSDESRNGHGVNLFAGAELRLFRGVGALIDVSRVSHNRRFDSGVRFRGSDAIASASVVGRFGKRTRRIQPYLLAGVSFIHSERRNESPVFDSADTEVSRFSRTTLAPSFGGGADIRVYEHVLLRTETRWYSTESLKLAVTASLGFTWR